MLKRFLKWSPQEGTCPLVGLQASTQRADVHHGMAYCHGDEVPTVRMVALKLYFP